MKARIPGGQGGGQMAMMKRIQEMQAQMEAKQQEIEQSEFSASCSFKSYKMRYLLIAIMTILVAPLQAN